MFRGEVLRSIRKIRQNVWTRSLYTGVLLISAVTISQTFLIGINLISLICSIIMLTIIELLAPLYSKKELEIERLYGASFGWLVSQNLIRTGINVLFALVLHFLIIDIIQSLSYQLVINHLFLIIAYSIIFLNLFCVSTVRTLVQWNSPVERPD